ncbi:MAG: hypothetical protein ACR2N5_05395 [Solirubrobacterales bacterium]
MKRLTPLQIRAWALPLVVLMIVLPGAGGFLVAGPALGMAGGALAATAVAVVAARARYDEPIEVASAGDDVYHLLVVVTTSVDPQAATQIAARVHNEADRAGRDADDHVDVLVLAPVLNRGLTHWASDLGTALVRAQGRLVISLASLAAASVGGRGEIGDTDPLQATEDTLRTFPAQEVLLVEEQGAGDRVRDELRRRLDRPLARLTVDSRERELARG